jgi:8-oxo-dGTP pyrophosphatase MutT (NUDIX family)
MSEAETVFRKPEGPPRVPGARAVRPKNAATVLIIRRDAKKPRVLMGKRHGGHSFMPDRWVFPGGRIDRTDYRAPAATDMKPEADAERLMSLERQPDCGELEEIAWVDFDEAQTLPLPTVTRMMLKEAVLRMDEPARPKPFLRFRQGAMRPEHL